MTGIVLTQHSGILKPIAWVLGKIMEGIFSVLDLIGIPNIGLAIILFTVVVYLLMMPLTIKQQKFSKLSARMNPELQAINEKYKNKTDNASMMAKNEEIQAVYGKYGVSPTGSCLQLLIQMPILFALYRVINAIPAYVGKVKEAFFPLVDNVIDTQGAVEFIRDNMVNSGMYNKQFGNAAFEMGAHTDYVRNTIIDCLNRASTADFENLAGQFTVLADNVKSTMSRLAEYNNFLGLNIGNSPQYIISQAYGEKAWALVIGAVMVPVLAALTQWINVKLIPKQNNGNADDTMAATMNGMNMVMPIMSAFFCFSLPSGMGLYWIAGSVVRSIQQVLINKHIDKMDFEKIIEDNSAKNAKKIEKRKQQQEKINAYANMNTRNIQSRANMNAQGNTKGTAVSKGASGSGGSQSGRKPQTEGRGADSVSADSSSIRSKVNMVKQFNERNNKEN